MSRTDRTKPLWVRFAEHNPRPVHGHRYGTSQPQGPLRGSACGSPVCRRSGSRSTPLTIPFGDDGGLHGEGPGPGSIPLTE
ncbi:hypothetical protein F3087_07080 [Nocardia colli]|uniref:Uncharacterized protein n=1 Tax=Nocardia colli TaxID=2545717 RepID=A0A5N0EIG4_9NOCA|nr:hypothetical protein F3087_07080 [Nocardia colli]